MSAAFRRRGGKIIGRGACMFAAPGRFWAETEKDANVPGRIRAEMEKDGSVLGRFWAETEKGCQRRSGWWEAIDRRKEWVLI